MSTPASGNSAYATIADFLARCDVNTVAQLLSDTKVPLTAAQVAVSATLTDLLQEASGEVEASATVGQRYRIDLNATPPINDLAALTGNSARYLAGMVCTLALGKLYDRRPSRKQEEPQSCKIAREKLLALEEGKAVFGLIENQEAGNLQITIDSPAVVQQRRGPVVIASRFFGRRSRQYPQQPSV